MNIVKINLFNQTSEDIKEIKKLLKKVFRPIKQKNNMQVIFVSQEEIRELNKTFRNIDKSTDVLSFPNDDELDPSIGDVFISIEQARYQANDYGHSFEREIGFLAVHGYLHLLGFDHHSESEEKLMIEAQENILKKAKLERK
jgi:probable rRNA maturation factor